MYRLSVHLGRLVLLDRRVVHACGGGDKTLVNLVPGIDVGDIIYTAVIIWHN